MNNDDNDDGDNGDAAVYRHVRPVRTRVFDFIAREYRVFTE